MEGKLGQIGFVVTKTNWMSRAIAWFLGSPYSHAFLIINETETIETNEKVVHIDSLIDHTTNPDKSCEIYEPIGLFECEKDRILNAARAQLGIPYSYTKFAYLAVYLLLKKIGININWSIGGTVCDDVPAVSYQETHFDEVKDTRLDTEQLRQTLKGNPNWICVFKK